jgi:hypothetical protein
MNTLVQTPLKRREVPPTGVSTGKIGATGTPAIADWALVLQRLTEQIEGFGVRVKHELLGPETTGVFDGVSITTNANCDLETRCHNMAHAFGHIAQWSPHRPACEALYEALYAAKASKDANPAALEAALAAFREYEEEASQYAAWLYLDTGNATALPAFHQFARADMEAIVTFHRTGVAPVWKTFFAAWKDRYIHGEFALCPFAPRRIPPFVPAAIAPQEVIQGVSSTGSGK